MPTFETQRRNDRHGRNDDKKASWFEQLTQYLCSGNYGAFTREVRDAGGALDAFDDHTHPQG